MKNLVLTVVVLFLSTLCISQSIIDSYLDLENLNSEYNAEDAEHHLLELCRSNPNNGAYNYSLGELYYEQDEHKRAIYQFKRAQEVGLYYRSNFYLAGSYSRIGLYDSAIYFLNEHLGAPLSGRGFDQDLADSVFMPLHSLEEFKQLQPPVIQDSLNFTANWVTDIEYMSEMLKKTHLDPFNTISEQEWDMHIAQILQDIPSMSDNEILVRICQFLTYLGDGHTRVLSLLESNLTIKRLPIITKTFSDGCYIYGASEGYADLIGAKIIKVNQVPIDSVYQIVCSIIPVDNKFGYKFLFPYAFRNMNYLNGLGLCKDDEKVTIEFLKDGKTSSVEIVAFNDDEYPDLLSYHTRYNEKHPIYLEHYRKGNLKWYWYKYFDEQKILYVQINGIISIPESPLSDFCDSLKAMVTNMNIDAFVLDLRNNGGGNSELNKHILSLMLTDELNTKGTSFTILGCNTYSAAQNLTTVLENYTETIFIGEPTSSRPIFIGEVYPFRLPYSGISISSSNVHHQHGYSADTRIWTAPDIHIEYTFSDYINGIDPVLEEIKRYTLSGFQEAQ